MSYSSKQRLVSKTHDSGVMGVGLEAADGTRVGASPVPPGPSRSDLMVGSIGYPSTVVDEPRRTSQNLVLRYARTSQSVRICIALKSAPELISEH